MKRITNEMLKDYLVSVSIETGTPEFFTGYDENISRQYLAPTTAEGILICQEQIAYWQRVLKYYELRDRKEDDM